MKIPLEDNVWDILQKAQGGLGLNEGELLERSGVTAREWRALAGGDYPESVLFALAGVLGLRGEALVGLARGQWQPGEQSIDGVTLFNTCFGAMAVNAYLLWDPLTRDAALFDTGADADPLLAFLHEHQLRLGLILLTHSHGDHIFELDRIKEKTGASAWISDREPVEGANCFSVGREFRFGNLRVETRSTWGHSPGGTTYVIQGLDRPAAVVGDALFAGSMGGARVFYSEALRNNREQIYSLPEQTVLCPGHGPMTTVGEEKKHNPFYSAS